MQLRSPTQGAVAAGDERTVEAGLHALRQGGNAVDAAVAAALTAFVVEPGLTSPAGGGVALVRSGSDGRVRAHDFFAAVPGLDRPAGGTPPMVPLPVDYGAEVQIFHVGPASVGIPGMPAGLEHLHRRHGTLPLDALVEPALHHARQGFVVAGNLPVTTSLIAELLAQDPVVAALLLPGGEVIAEGAFLRMPELGDTLELFAREGAAPFYRGDVARALLAFAGGDRGSVTAADLAAYEAIERVPLCRPYRGATVHMNPPPGAGGVLLALAFGLLERCRCGIEALDGPTALLLTRIMAAADGARDARFFTSLDEADFVRGLLSDGQLDRLADALGRPQPTPPRDTSAGSTTQISTADADGWLVSMTSSNGESCGWMLPGTGVLLNNFLGEEDLQGPEGSTRLPGMRIRTMMTPTILTEADGTLAALGSGGANRIRSAVMQGIIHLVDRGCAPAEAVEHARIHHEDGVCRVELAGLESGLVEQLEQHLGEVTRYPDLHMYFGGLHLVRLRPDGTFDGAGDSRRSGAYQCTPAC
jgi:gamma-glutamyltranspeptidase / glutathione hydrolase